MLILVSLPGSLHADAHRTPGMISSETPEDQPPPTDRPVRNAAELTSVYLPLVMQAGTSVREGAIWAHAAPPHPHEVALFRHTFRIDTSFTAARLSIFADTRYEVWLDGTRIGRGPARFSRQTREYDVYELGQLTPGSHVLAVLVQWAPNNRRSESSTPVLQADITGMNAQGRVVVARTGSHWKALRSPAWRPDAVPVHSWGLLGPTELLDLRELPADWMAPGFADEQWPAAVLTAPPTSIDQPRSIPLLAQVPIPATIHDAGLLSPDHLIGELTPALSDPYSVTLNAPTTGFLRALETDGLTGTVQIDGVPLTWETRPAQHPDVRNASATLPSGTQTLLFRDLPPQGLTVSLARQSNPTTVLPFQQGRHAGRRLLLANPVPGREGIEITGDTHRRVEFTRLPAYVVLDLGRVVHGRLTAEVTGPAGTVVDIGWDERLWQQQRPLPFPGSLHPEWNQTDSWVLDGTTRAISTIDARAGRYVLIAVWGDAPVTIDQLQVVEERYPVTLQGRFQSSNTQLNRIWQIGVDTAYPNMSDAYADPWRERGQWWGDAYVVDHVNQVAFGDTQLLRRGLLLMAEAFENGRPHALAPNGSGNHMLDYGMLWVQSLHDYARRTGDRTVLDQAYPALTSFLRYLEEYRHPTSGLLDIPYDHWSQTVYIDSSVFYDRYGQSTVVNAIYYGTLIDAAAIAEQVGDNSSAAAWRNRAATLRSQVNQELYLPNTGRYVQTIFLGATFEPSVHAQAWALAYGLVADDQVQRVADALLELLSDNPAQPNVQVYGMFWVLEGLARADRHADALKVIERYYGHMLQHGATTWWEHFNAHRSYSASLSHGWGGSPTWFLTSYVLGAQQTGPQHWSIRPALTGLDVAEGSLPLPDGPLQVRWERQDCAHSRIELTAPPGTAGELRVRQAESLLTLTLNDSVVWQNETALDERVTARSGEIWLDLGAGRHTLALEQSCYRMFLPLVESD